MKTYEMGDLLWLGQYEGIIYDECKPSYEDITLYDDIDRKRIVIEYIGHASGCVVFLYCVKFHPWLSKVLYNGRGIYMKFVRTPTLLRRFDETS